MLKRKREGFQESRTRPNPGQKRLNNIRREIAEIGEPAKDSVEETLAYLASDILAAIQEFREEILEIMQAVIYEQPHKIPFLAAVVEILNSSAPEFGLAVVEMSQSHISSSVLKGDYSRLKQFLRFACSLTISDKQNLLTLLQNLISRALTHPEQKLSAYIYVSVLNAAVYLQYSGTELGEDLIGALKSFRKSTNSTIAQDTAPFTGSDAPYEARSYIEHWGRALDAQGDKWDTSFLVSMDDLIPSRKPIESLHHFSAVHLPETLVQSSNEVHNLFRPFLRVYLDEAVETVPSPDTIFGQLLRDIAGDIIRHMDFNRKEVTRQLVTLDLFFKPDLFAEPGLSLDALKELQNPKSTFKIEDVALEAVLDQMLELPSPGFPVVYFDSILIEACVMTPQAIAPVLGRALRFFFANCQSLEVELFYRVVDWFSHHASNFAFTWKWNEWIDKLSLPRFHPQQVFMRELISKQVRLSYPKRILEVVPAEFESVVPKVPEIPDFEYEKDSLAQAVVDALQKTESDAEASMTALEERETTNSIGKPVIDMQRYLARVLVTALCHVGNRSISHAETCIRRARKLIEKYCTEESLIITSVLDYWSPSDWVTSLVLGSYVDQGFLRVESLVEYVCDHPSFLISSVGWEILNRYISTTFSHLDQLLQTREEEEWVSYWRKSLARALRRVHDSQVKEQDAGEDAMIVDKVQDVQDVQDVNVQDAVQDASEDAKVEDAKVEDAKVEDAKVEDAKVEDAKVEDAKVDDAKVEDVQDAAQDVSEDAKVKDVNVQAANVTQDSSIASEPNATCGPTTGEPITSDPPTTSGPITTDPNTTAPSDSVEAADASAQTVPSAHSPTAISDNPPNSDAMQD